MLKFNMTNTHAQKEEKIDYYLNKNYDSAIYYLNQKRDELTSTLDSFKYYDRLTILYDNQNLFDSAYKYNNYALAIALRSKNESLLEIGYQNKAQLFDYNLDSLVYYARKSLSHSKGDPHKLAVTYFLLNDYFLTNNQFDSSRKYRELSYQQSVLSNNHRFMAVNLASKGLSFYKKSQYDSSIVYYHKALTFLEEYEHDYFHLSNIHNQIGGIYYFLENFPLAKYHFKQSLVYGEQLGSPQKVIESQNNLGACYSKLNEFDSAIFYLSQVINTSKEKNMLLTLSGAYTNVSQIYLKKGNLKEAKELQLKSIAIDDKRNDTYGLAIGYANLHEILLLQGKSSEAIQSLRKAFSFSEDAKTDEIKLACLDLFIAFFKQTKVLDSVVYYQQLKFDLNEKIKGERVKNTIEELKIKYETDLLTKTNENLKLEGDIKQEKYQKQVIISLLTIILLIITILFFVSSIRNKQKKLKYQKLQNDKLKSEILHFLSVIKDKNEIIERIKVDQTHDDITKQAVINSLHNEDDWIKFQTGFSKLYPSFLDNLKQTSTELTINDERLASLIRLGLSNKEISEVLFITISGVKMAKNRLNKKINEEGEETITSFIKSL